MSGHKRATITISQEEFQRLKDAEIQLKALPAVTNENQEAMVRQMQSALHENINWLSARQDRFANMFDGYQSEIAGLQDDTNRMITEKNEKTRRELSAAMGSLWENTELVISQAVDGFQNQFQHIQDWFSQEVGAVQEQVNWIVADQYARVEIAGQWLDAAQTLLQAISAEYHHETFAPGQVDRLASRMSLASQNLQANMPESALTMAQQIFMEANELRINLEQAETEWVVLYQAVTEAVYQMQAEILAGGSIQAMDLDGQALPYTLDADYWTGGKWSDTADHFQYTVEQLGQPEQIPPTEFLNYLLHRYLPDLRETLSNLVYETRVAALNSQLRINIADLVVQALNEQGYLLNNATYLKEDWRDSYYAQLACVDGSQVIVQVDPVGRAVGENALHLVSSDGEERSERELSQRWEEVAQSLSAWGLDVEPYEVARGSTRKRSRTVQEAPVAQKRVSIQNRNGA
jgi:hypothetical protein